MTSLPTSPRTVESLIDKKFILLLSRNLSVKEKNQLNKHFTKIVDVDINLHKTKSLETFLPFNLLIVDLQQKDEHRWIESVIPDVLQQPNSYQFIFLKKTYWNYQFDKIPAEVQYCVLSDIPEVERTEEFLRYLIRIKIPKIQSRTKQLFYKVARIFIA